jgi:hypothetical protein
MTGQNNLKHKIIIGGIVAVVIPFVITGAIIYIQLSGNLMQMAKEKSLHLSSTLGRPIQKKFDIFLIRSVQKELIFSSVCHLTH